MEEPAALPWAAPREGPLCVMTSVHPASNPLVSHGDSEAWGGPGSQVQPLHHLLGSWGTEKEGFMGLASFF